jgi:uncharacterized metal-binding protein
MASGKQHSQATLAAGIPVGMVYYLITENAPPAAIYGCLAGVLLSPDLDIPTKTISEYYMGKIPVIGCLFYWYWLPYAKLVPHRHWISHAPIIGTAVRLLYISPLLLLFDTVWLYKVDVLGFVFGLMISDFLHWIMDKK